MAFTQKVCSISVAAILLMMAAAVVVAVIGLNNAPTASATFPGTNGRIAFQGEGPTSYDIFVMNADGNGITNLSNNPAFETDPSFSPDGAKIAFVSSRDYLSSNTEIYVMNADGSNQTRLTHTGLADHPRWSPDGSKILFQGPDGIYVMNADRKNLKRLVQENFAQMAPDWSPDGKKIAFVSPRDFIPLDNTDIYIMNSDGSNQTRLTHTGIASSPNWSPDGTKILFNRGGAISVVNANGAGPIADVETIRDNLAKDNPVWSPDGTKIAFEGPEFSNSSGNGIYVANADGSDTVLIAHRLSTNPSWGVKSSIILPLPPTPRTPTLAVNSVDLSDKPVSGVWTAVWNRDGALVKSGFTPLTIAGLEEGQYKVGVANYDGKVFQHWDDTFTGGTSTTTNTRTVDLTADTTLTAVYDTGHSLRGFTPLAFTGTTQQPDLTVNAATIIEGNNTTMLHMWMIIDPQQSTITTNSSGTPTTTYKVYATNGYQNLVFDHWSDKGSTDRFRTLRINEPTTITAYYRAG